ncbi:MAG: nucleotidyltransferase domain-containing protein [Promethearchaeota archaeon]
MDKVIPLRVDEALSGGIDALIASGKFRSRNEGIREGIRMVIQRYGPRRDSARFVVAKLSANFLSGLATGEVDAVVLFGSVARGTDTRESDVDLLVLTSRPLDYRERFAVTDELQRVLSGIDELVSLHFLPAADFRANLERGYSFERGVRSEGILLAGEWPCAGTRSRAPLRRGGG